MQNREMKNQEIANHAFDAIDDILEASTYQQDPEPKYIFWLVHGIITMARKMMSPIYAYTRLGMVDYIKTHPEEFADYKPFKKEETE